MRYDETLSAEFRRDHGVHYTPDSIAAEIVEKTLSPLLRDCSTSNYIRALRVGDIAMGDGIFLCEAVEWLGRRLFNAWSSEGVDFRSEDDGLWLARYTVATECMFGVELDPVAAAEARRLMAITVDDEFEPREPEGKAFAHLLRSGDALVGLTAHEIACLDWEPGEPVEELARASYELGKLAGDCVVGAWFAADKDKARRQELLYRQPVIIRAARGDMSALEQAKTWQAELLAKVPAFHWELEFPWLFSPIPGLPSLITSIVGNPPYVGGSNISSVNGKTYLEWIQMRFPGCEGRCDLAAYFFRQAWKLLGRGTMGQIATNTIIDGDTRAGGIQPIKQEYGKVYEVEVGRPWPGKAAVTTNTLYISKHEAVPWHEDAVITGSEKALNDNRLKIKHRVIA